MSTESTLPASAAGTVDASLDALASVLLNLAPSDRAKLAAALLHHGRPNEGAAVTGGPTDG